MASALGACSLNKLTGTCLSTDDSYTCVANPNVASGCSAYLKPPAGFSHDHQDHSGDAYYAKGDRCTAVSDCTLYIQPDVTNGGAGNATAAPKLSWTSPSSWADAYGDAGHRGPAHGGHHRPAHGGGSGYAPHSIFSGMTPMCRAVTGPHAGTVVDCDSLAAGGGGGPGAAVSCAVAPGATTGECVYQPPPASKPPAPTPPPSPSPPALMPLPPTLRAFRLGVPATVPGSGYSVPGVWRRQ
jgi:hypothetical protein